jgi:hypothetical protein
MFSAALNKDPFALIPLEDSSPTLSFSSSIISYVAAFLFAHAYLSGAFYPTFLEIYPLKVLFVRGSGGFLPNKFTILKVRFFSPSCPGGVF